MSGRDFLDTNILLYAYSPADPLKQKIAADLVTRAVAGGSAISTQVLAEFASVLLHKVSPTKTADEVKQILDVLAPIKVVVPDGDLVRRAVEAKGTYGVHFYDGMIIAAAERDGAERVWSEDLNPGQTYFGVTVANPFQ